MLLNECHTYLPCINRETFWYMVNSSNRSDIQNLLLIGSSHLRKLQHKCLNRSLMQAHRVWQCNRNNRADTWERLLRSLLRDPTVRKHLEGSAIPIEEQVVTLSRKVQSIVDGHARGYEDNQWQSGVELVSRFSWST